MNRTALLIGICLSLLAAITGIWISLTGFLHSWSTLVYLGKFDKPLGEFDLTIDTQLSRSEHLFGLLFIFFIFIFVVNIFCLHRLWRAGNKDGRVV